MTTAPDIEADRAGAIRQHIRAIEALLDGAPVEQEDDRQWPPDNIDRRENYWEWMALDDAAAKGPYKRTKLQGIRFLVSMTDGRARWFSLRRIWQVHGSDELRQNSALTVKT